LSAHPNTTPLTLKLGVNAHQPWHRVAKLGKFNLQLTFPSSRPPGENVKDQLRPVNDFPFESCENISSLNSGEFAVEDHDFGAGFYDVLFELKKFPGANKAALSGTINALAHGPNKRKLGGFAKPLKFCLDIKVLVYILVNINEEDGFLDIPGIFMFN
jgi:hypothetical protein